MEVERLQQEYDFDVQFAPFYLHPETPPEGAPARRIIPPEAPATPMEERGHKLGIRFTRGRTRSSNSYLAFQAAEYAVEHGAEWRFHREMFKAYFDNLEDIGKIDTIVEVAGRSGLDRDEARAALEDGRYRERVDDGINWSRSIGVTAIPTFIFDERYAMVGAHELDAFRQMMGRLWHSPRSAEG